MAKAKLDDRLAFVVKAVSDDETRYFMTKAYFEDGTDPNYPGEVRLVATDGRRLHWAQFDSLQTAAGFGLEKTGYYDVAGERFVLDKLLNGQGAQFPNYRKVIPEYETGAIRDQHDLDFAHPGTMVPILCAKTGMAFNYTYLADFKAMKKYKCNMVYAEKGRAARFDFLNCGAIQVRAVVMPMKLD